MMTKQTWTMYIYKVDRRSKTGKRLHSTSVWTDRDEATMHREVAELHGQLYLRSQFKIIFVPHFV